ncbi:MAG: galactokinase [Thermodesulfobacteriota bacterium]|nr:galactokinase [Thermodesulfobacteriota bacterium]
MIITRTPFRVPLGGGGTDLPSYYSKYGGFIFSAAIDKYMFISINQPIVDELIRIKYSKSETVSSVDEVQHEIVREILRCLGIKNRIEVTSMADVPAGTGLGSSGAYTVGLLNGLHTLKRESLTLQQLAEEACKIEIDILGKPIGKHDQYIAAFGGLTCLEIEKDGTVKVCNGQISHAVIDELEKNILLFYTGISRDANEILSSQSQAAKEDDNRVVDTLHRIKEIGYQVKEALEDGNLAKFGYLLDKHWQTKKNLSGKISDSRIDRLYEKAKENGALGGKIMGAGGGGFFMFYCEEHRNRLRKAMAEEGLREMRYRFDFEGSKVLINLFNPRDGCSFNH